VTRPRRAARVAIALLVFARLPAEIVADAAPSTLPASYWTLAQSKPILDKTLGE